MNRLFHNTNIIIINFNGKTITANCIDSILENNFPEKNIIVSDNASNDDSCIYLKKKYPQINIVANSTNAGYAAAINSGASVADKKYLVLSNNDVIYKNNSLTNLLKHIDNEPETGTAGPQQIFPNGSWQRSAGLLPLPQNRFKEIFLYPALMDFIRKINFKFNLTKDTFTSEYIDGAVIAVRKSIFDRLGGFDSDNYFFYSEEADFCYRISKLGLKNVIVPKSTVIHLRGASSKEIKINNQAIEMLINSKMIFLGKFFNSKEIIKYINSIIINHKIYLIIWKIVEKTGLFKTEITKNKIDFFEKSNEIWLSKKDSVSSSKNNTVQNNNLK